MKSFDDVGAFARHLGSLGTAVRRAETAGVDAGAALIEAEAKAVIGNYQEGAGGLPGWAPLSEHTLYGGVSPSGHRYPGKVELGYAPPDNPELRTGALRDSIGRKVEGRSAAIGSDSDVMVWQELGTRYMPPRPILGLAAVHKGEAAARTIGEAVAYAVAGMRPPVRPPIGG